MHAGKRSANNHAAAGRTNHFNSSVECSCRGGTSTWHLPSSTEPFDLAQQLWQTLNVSIGRQRRRRWQADGVGRLP
eukprot:4688762-Prymnesium_polylepis.1